MGPKVRYLYRALMVQHITQQPLNPNRKYPGLLGAVAEGVRIQKMVKFRE